MEIEEQKPAETKRTWSRAPRWARDLNKETEIDNKNQTENQGLKSPELDTKKTVSPEARLPAKLNRTPRGAKRAMLTLARDIMERENTCPLTTLLRMSKSRRLPITVRLQAAAAAAPFCFPKLSSIAVNLKDDNRAKFQDALLAVMSNPERLREAQTLSLALSDAQRDQHAPGLLAPPHRQDIKDADILDAEFCDAPEPPRNA